MSGIKNKTVVLSILLFFFVAQVGLYSQQPESEITADSLYSAGEYEAALNNYLSIEQEGFISWSLYYNIGNCYFKRQEYGKSILYYERALKLNPSDEDIIYNLEYVRQYTIDEIDVVPEFFLKTWVRNLNYRFSSNSWINISISLFILTLLLLLLFRYGPSQTLRKSSFFLALFAFALSVIFSVFSFNQKNSFYSDDAAIILSPVTTVRNAPDNSGSALFVLHEGTKLQTIEKIGSWTRIELLDGRQGWILTEDIESI